MKKVSTTLVGIFLLMLLTSPRVYSQSPKTAANNSQHTHDAGGLVEEFSFLIKDLRVDHQSETNNVNISISYRYVVDVKNSDYPDFRLLAKDVETLLDKYPNEADYWEIVNKNLTSLLLKKYAALASVTCELKVDPTKLDPYTRSSRVTRERPVSKSGPKRT